MYVPRHVKFTCKRVVFSCYIVSYFGCKHEYEYQYWCITSIIQSEYCFRVSERSEQTRVWALVSQNQTLWLALRDQKCDPVAHSDETPWEKRARTNPSLFASGLAVSRYATPDKSNVERTSHWFWLGSGRENADGTSARVSWKQERLAAIQNGWLSFKPKLLSPYRDDEAFLLEVLHQWHCVLFEVG